MIDLSLLVVFEKLLIGFCVIYICLSRPKAHLQVSLFYAGAVLIHQLLFQYFDDIQLYYISAGLFDLSVLCAIAIMKAHPRLSTDIQYISMVSILFNGIGYLTHNPNQEPYAYIMMYVFLYGWSIYILLRGEPHGDIEIDTRPLSIRPNVRFRFVHNYLQKEKECRTE